MSTRERKRTDSEIGCEPCGDPVKKTDRGGGNPDGGELTIARLYVVRTVLCATGTLLNSRPQLTTYQSADSTTYGAVSSVEAAGRTSKSWMMNTSRPNQASAKTRPFFAIRTRAYTTTKNPCRCSSIHASKSFHDAIYPSK